MFPVRLLVSSHEKFRHWNLPHTLLIARCVAWRPAQSSLVQFKLTDALSSARLNIHNICSLYTNINYNIQNAK